MSRAAELQGTGSDAESTEQFTEDQLIELGKEVGLSPQNLRQALAEERTRSVVPESDERGLTASVFGPSRVHATRTVPGKPGEVLAQIDAWMQRQETLIVKRQFGDRTVWEPSRDLGVTLKRAFKAGGRDFALANAHEVSATVMAVDDGRVHVVLDGDFTNRRSVAVGSAAGGVVTGAAVTGALLVISVPVLLAALPAIALAGSSVAGARSFHGRTMTRAQLALEQLLDRLERGEMRRGPDSLLGAIVGAVTQQLPPRRY